MTARTAWVAGNGAGLTWTSLFGSEVSTLPSTDSVLSSVSITNQTALDQFMDISLEATISSSTIAAGAAFTLWTMPLMEDGLTYGDGSLTAHTSTNIPGLFPVATMPIRAAATTTHVYGYVQSILIPPLTFAMGINNAIGFNLTACTIKYITYNLNLNS